MGRDTGPMGHRYLICGFLVLACTDCGARQEPPTPEPATPTVVVADPEPATPPCELACTRLTELDCMDATGTNMAGCVEVCDNMERSGVASFCPVAVSKIDGCDDVQAAFASCD